MRRFRAAWQILRFGILIIGESVVAEMLAQEKNYRCGIGGCRGGEGWFSAAIMAPTEILAQQHAKTLDSYCRHLVLSVALLTGHVKVWRAINYQDNLASGSIDVVVARAR